MRMHGTGMAMVLACAGMAGSASMHTHDVRPDAPKLPPAAVLRLPQTAAVYFSEAFRTARPEHAVNFLGDVQTWRHELGDASVETFRQALAVQRREPVATDRTEFVPRLGAVGLLLPIPFFSSNATEACEQMQSYVRRALGQ